MSDALSHESMVQALLIERHQMRELLQNMQLLNEAWFGMAQEVLRVFGDDYVTVDQEELVKRVRAMVELKMQGKI